MCKHWTNKPDLLLTKEVLVSIPFFNNIKKKIVFRIKSHANR